MDTQKLHEIIQACTRVYRKAEAVHITQDRDHGLDVIELFGYEHTSEAPTEDNFDKVDMVFVDVVVDRAQAEKYRLELVNNLRDYPQPDRLAGGPSYIELAPNLGMEQESALRLMALGQTLGLWQVTSGKTLGMDDAMAKQMAGQGLLMISGYDPNKKLTPSK